MGVKVDSNFVKYALKPFATVGWRIDREDGCVEFHCGHSTGWGNGQFVIELERVALQTFNDQVLPPAELIEIVKREIKEVCDLQGVELMLDEATVKRRIAFMRRPHN